MRKRNNFQLILGLVALMLLASCQETEKPIDGFLVEGDVKGLGDSQILVLKLINGNLELDTIQPLDDKFTYTGKVKEPYFIQMLTIAGDSTTGKLAEFMLENSRISVTGNSIEYDSVTVSGSVSDKVLKAYFKEDDALTAEWDALKVKYDAAVEAKDSIERKKLAKQLNQIFKGDRVELLKKYVTEHKDTKVGALIPAFCTIENALTPADYRELYDTLADSIQQTDYGQELLSRATVEKE